MNALLIKELVLALCSKNSLETRRADEYKYTQYFWFREEFSFSLNSELPTETNEIQLMYLAGVFQNIEVQ